MAEHDFTTAMKWVSAGIAETHRSATELHLVLEVV